MKKKILFIINPISGAGPQGLLRSRHKTVEKLIGKKLNRTIFDYELAYTKAAKHAIELAKKAVEEKFNIVVAVGGDGSVNEVGRSLVGTGSALGILPCGSGNGTARHLKIPINLTKAMQIINQGNTTKIDTFNVNDEIAINVAGIGYAAHIAHKFSKLKKRGFSNYLKIAVRDSMKYRSQRCEIEITSSPSPSPKGEGSTSESKIIKVNAFIIDIANGSQWGNNAVIAPDAKTDDGLLDLCVVRHFPYILFPMMALRLFTRSIHHSKYVEIIKVKEVIIRQERDYAHIDGEPVIIGNELKIKINPLSLKVVVP
jgi:YegS/Rv2252/BmrU family lipid kinase